MRLLSKATTFLIVYSPFSLPYWNLLCSELRTTAPSSVCSLPLN